MTNSESVYEYEERDRHPLKTQYYFLSEGQKPILKVVEYAYLGIKNKRLTYNLGFGTYDEEQGVILDDDISDNGDVYKVFNTVLATIPDFLHNYVGAMVLVEGSDSAVAFPEKCRPTCKKNCIPPICKNAHRRINLYKSFINKNYDWLSVGYTFWGSVGKIDNEIVMRDYKPFEDYESVLFIKK